MPAPTFDNTTISFRFATHDDAVLLCALAEQTFYEAFASFNTSEDMLLYTRQAFALQRIEKEINEQHTWYLLVHHGDLLIGYARLKINQHEALHAEPAMEIERFYIAATYTGKHIGSLLMQECLTFATQQHCTVVWLGVWEHNQRALAFYKKWKFTLFGSHPFLLGDDLQTDLLMKKELS